MIRSPRVPIGLLVASTAKAIDRAFDDALAAVGGSRVTWLILMNLRRTPGASQRELADAIGVRGATLTHHLNAMEKRGLLGRQRDEANRRVHRVTLTALGDEAFTSMLASVDTFDRRLRHNLDDAALDQLERGLATLRDNILGATPIAGRRHEPLVDGREPIGSRDRAAVAAPGVGFGTPGAHRRP